MRKKGLWILVTVFAIVIGFYPVLYFILDRKFGLLSTKDNALLANTLWNTGFYTHIIFGGIALLIGWIQFNQNIRNKYLALHRQIGKIYIAAVLLSGTAGIGIGFFATGGMITAMGFICLGIIWLYTTLRAYGHIKNRRIQQHEKMMIYSYAACFAAVTLRIWLPLLILIFGDFIIAYTIVAWLCWIPNIVVAGIIVKSRGLTGSSAP